MHLGYADFFLWTILCGIPSAGVDGLCEVPGNRTSFAAMNRVQGLLRYGVVLVCSSALATTDSGLF